MAATQKRKRVSKKNKKSWRKNVDITDVDSFLEDQRLEERLGRNLQQKTNDELFSIDVSGEADLQNTNGPAKVAPKRSLRLKESTIPQCYALLERRSAVPDPVGKRSGVRIKEKVKKPALTGVVKHTKKPYLTRHLAKIRYRPIWDEVDKSRELNGLAEWLYPETVTHALHNTGNKKTQRPDLKKPSPLAAVEAPHPGMSYNPSLKDHRKLIQSVAEVEADIQKKEKHIERVTTKMFRKIPVEEAEKAWLTEMSVGLHESSESAPEEGDYTTINPPVERKKKTLKERRKARENRERLLKLKYAKLEKKKRADINERLSKLKTNIDKKEEASLKYQERKKEREISKIGETKILGKTKYEEPPLDFQSPHELRGSLRQLEPTGSVLSDRFHSLQKRNFVEPTLCRNPRNAKGKRVVKHSHKMGWEPKGY